MKAKEYEVLDMAVRDGVSCGVTRAFKYTDNPARENLVDEVHHQVMASMCEWFLLEGEEDPRPAQRPREFWGDISDGGDHD
jgi:hypothetical protein